MLKQLVIVARLRQQISQRRRAISNSKTTSPTSPSIQNNDATTDWLVRQAALNAQRLRSANANRALLLALGIFMDDSMSLRSFPQTSSFVQQVESDAERLARLRVLGKPTMHGRRDLVKHFFVSAFFVAAANGKAARLLGLTKEWADARGASGFSFADIAADRAGIVFAERLLDGQLRLTSVSRKFSCEAFLPAIDGLPDNLTDIELKKQFGGVGSKKSR